MSKPSAEKDETPVVADLVARIRARRRTEAIRGVLQKLLSRPPAKYPDGVVEEFLASLGRPRKK